MFQACCLSDPQAMALRSRLHEFSAVLTEWRWGYVTQTLQDLAELEDLLVVYWNTRKLVAGSNSQSKRGDDLDEGFGAPAVHAAEVFVSSPAHWAYLHMLLGVMDVLTHTQRWFESCCCHDSVRASPARIRAGSAC